MMRILVGAILLAAATLAHVQSASADEPSDVLQIVAVPPPKPTNILGTAWSIWISGVIDRDAPTRFAKLIADNRIGLGFVYLNSPGGSVYAAMELGRLIRQHQFTTTVAKPGNWREVRPGWGKLYEAEPAQCASACALTFLGGTFRDVPEKSLYGVHRFYASALSADAAQVTSADVIQYIHEMGIDVGLFSEMAQAGKDEIRLLSRTRMVTLGVINGSSTKTTWTIESDPAGLAMKGYRKTGFGEQKILFVCDANTKGLVAMAFFDPQGRQSEVPNMKAVTFSIDGEERQVSVADVRVTGAGWATVIFWLREPLLQKLKAAKTIGVWVQYAYGAPFFLGINDMDFGSGSQMLLGYLASCHL
jgi:hypothetical protein